MEEIDGIIISAVREIGCYVDKNVKSVRNLPADTILEAVVRCLKILDPKTEFPTSLSNNMSARVSACAEIAQAVKDLGYNKGDLGYHQLLYPNENDTRSLLGWLTRMLPSTENEEEANKKQAVKGDSGEIIQKAIEAKLLQLQKTSWTPSFCLVGDGHLDHKKAVRLHTSPVINPFVNPNKVQSRAVAQELQDFFRDEVDFVTRQPARRVDVVPSIIEHNFSTYTEAREREDEWNSVGLDSGLNPWQYRNRKRTKIITEMSAHIRSNLEESEAIFQKSYGDAAEKRKMQKSKANRYTNLVEFTQEEVAIQEQTEEELRKQREEELAALEAQLTAVREKIEYVRNEMESFHARMRQADANLLAEIEKYNSLEEDHRINTKIFLELLPDAENNIRILKNISQESAARLMQLAKEWEQHRVPMIEAYRNARFAYLNRDDGSDVLLEDIKGMRSQMKQLEAEINAKDEEYKELLEIYRQLPKNINRSVYTKRILDIVKQVKKQKVDINKILIDTRALKKEINTNIETLGRIFALSTEIIFQDAKKDAAAKQVYRDLCAKHDKFKELSDIVGETGNTTNAILDLEERVQQVSQRASSLDVDQITRDLESIRNENAQLLAQLQS